MGDAFREMSRAVVAGEPMKRERFTALPAWPARPDDDALLHRAMRLYERQRALAIKAGKRGHNVQSDQRDHDGETILRLAEEIRRLRSEAKA